MTVLLVNEHGSFEKSEVRAESMLHNFDFTLKANLTMPNGRSNWSIPCHIFSRIAQAELTGCASR